MITIGELGKKFSLSRSTLLYYSKIGLLMPSQRTEANYRLYTEDNEKCLEKICLYRKTGMSLKKIKSILDSNHNPALEERLKQLNEELNNIQSQQRMILALMQNPSAEDIVSLLTPERFEKLLKSAGLNEENTRMFHAKLEMASLKEHREFLEFLGIEDEKRNEIILQAREYIKNNKMC